MAEEKTEAMESAILPAPEAAAEAATSEAATPAEPTEPTVSYTPEEWVAHLKTLDSKTLRTKYPDVWEKAIRPHIDREVQINRQNLEKKYSEEVATRQKAQEWLASWYKLTPVQQANAINEDPNVGIALAQARAIVATPSPAMRTREEVADEIWQRARQKLREDFADMEEGVFETSDLGDLISRISKSIIEREKKAIRSEMEKELNARVKAKLAELHISSEQLERPLGAGKAPKGSDEELLAAAAKGEAVDLARVAQLLGMRLSQPRPQASK